MPVINVNENGKLIYSIESKLTSYDLYATMLTVMYPEVKLNLTEIVLLTGLLESYTGNPFKITAKLKEDLLLNFDKKFGLSVFNNATRTLVQAGLIIPVENLYRQYDFPKKIQDDLKRIQKSKK